MTDFTSGFLIGQNLRKIKKICEILKKGWKPKNPKYLSLGVDTGKF